MGDRTLVCIPTYNERENLPSLLEEVLATTDVDVLVIDDNSPDGTGAVADVVASRSPRVRVLHRPEKRGLGAAYLAGFAAALADGYDRVVEMDADFSHQPRHLPALLRAADRADVVIGSRYVPGGGTVNWGVVRRVLSRGGSAYARAVLGLPYRDLTSGFKVFHRRVLQSIDLGSIETVGYAFQIELVYRAHRRGFSIEEVPIMFFERTSGRSKMSSAIVAEAVTKLWLLRARDR
jgi:dolichol-phosphate mannosyltransferase